VSSSIYCKPIRVFLSWWRGILLVLLLLSSVSSSSLVFTYAFQLLFLNYYWFIFAFPRNLPPQCAPLCLHHTCVSSRLSSATPHWRIVSSPLPRWTGRACRAAASSAPWRCWGGRAPWSNWGCWGRLCVWVTSWPRSLRCTPSDIPTASTKAIPTDWAWTGFKRQVAFCWERDVWSYWAYGGTDSRWK